MWAMLTLVDRWNASRAFASYLDEYPELYRDSTVLELGAGGALPGIVAAKNGAKTVRYLDLLDTLCSPVLTVARSGCYNGLS